MMKANLHLILMAAGLTLASCGGPPSRATLLVQSVWKFSEMTSSATDSANLATVKRNKKFLVDQELRFRKDNTYISIFPSSADVNANSRGNWKFSAEQTQLIMAGNGNELMWNIEKLDDEFLEIKRHDQNLNADIRFLYKKK